MIAHHSPDAGPALSLSRAGGLGQRPVGAHRIVSGPAPAPQSREIASVELACSRGRCPGACGRVGAHGDRPREEGRQMIWYGPHMGGWGWALGSLVFWALVALAIVALIRFFSRGG